MKLCDLSQYGAGNHGASIQQYIVITEKRGNRFENHPTRQYPIKNVLGPEAKPIIFVEVVSPTDAIGHPQLINALR